MTTDKRTNEPTDEQIEADALLSQIESARVLAGLMRAWDVSPEQLETLRSTLESVERCAALVAAQGAAPQAESDVQESPVIENLGEEISITVQPSSAVDEGKLADEMERHRHVMVAPGPHQCSCSFVMSEDPGFSGWAREHKLHVARAVVEAIGGESR